MVLPRLLDFSGVSSNVWNVKRSASGSSSSRKRRASSRFGSSAARVSVVTARPTARPRAARLVIGADRRAALLGLGDQIQVEALADRGIHYLREDVRRQRLGLDHARLLEILRQVVEPDLLGRDGDPGEADVALVLVEGGDVLCEHLEDRLAVPIQVADVQHFERHACRPDELDDLPLVGDRVETAAGDGVDPVRRADALELREHAGGLAPQDHGARLRRQWIKVEGPHLVCDRPREIARVGEPEQGRRHRAALVVDVLERDDPGPPRLAQHVGEVAVLERRLLDHQPRDQHVEDLPHGHRQVVVVGGEHVLDRVQLRADPRGRPPRDVAAIAAVRAHGSAHERRRPRPAPRRPRRRPWSRRPSSLDLALRLVVMSSTSADAGEVATTADPSAAGAARGHG